MKEFKELINSISQIKEYFPILIKNVEFCFYESSINLRLKPYLTHNQRNIFIQSEYFDSLNEREKKFVLILNLMINHELIDTIGKEALNSIEVINYHTKLLTLDKELMENLSIPEEYHQLLVDNYIYTNPYKVGAVTKEEINVFSLFTEDLPNLKHVEDDFDSGSSFNCIKVGEDSKYQKISAYDKKYYDDVLYLYWKHVSYRPTLNILSEFLSKLMLNVENQSDRIALGTKRRKERRIVGVEANKTYNADEIVIHYNGVKESATGVRIIIENCINEFNSKSKISSSINIVTSILENTNIDMNTILIEAKCNSKNKSDTGSNPKNISFRFIDFIDKILDYPNENILLFDNPNIVYRLNSRR